MMQALADHALTSILPPSSPKLLASFQVQLPPQLHHYMAVEGQKYSENLS